MLQFGRTIAFRVIASSRICNFVWTSLLQSVLAFLAHCVLLVLQGTRSKVPIVVERRGALYYILCFAISFLATD